MMALVAHMGCGWYLTQDETMEVTMTSAASLKRMTIGEAAQSSGVSAKMIRYYEDVGLMQPAARTRAGYRVYSENDVNELRFIRRARDLGFTVAQVGELLALWRDRTRASADVRALALRHVEELESRAAELHAMSKTLRHLAATCHGDERPDCPILDEFAGVSSAVMKDS